jgi:hypothetical protein
MGTLCDREKFLPAVKFNEWPPVRMLVREVNLAFQDIGKI